MKISRSLTYGRTLETIKEDEELFFYRKPTASMMFRQYLIKKWRKWKNSPNCLFRVFVLTILLGCLTYLIFFVRQMQENLMSLEFDYYDEQVRKGNIVKVKEFEPKKFKTLERPRALIGNPHFEFMTNVWNHKSWCKPNSNKIRTLLIMVFSSSSNAGHRLLIRNLWGSLNRIRNWEIKLVFIIGGKHRKHINKEMFRYKDIIMGNFKDEESQEHQLAYYLMGYKWTLTYCSNAEYVLQTLDTTFVDMFQVIEMIHYKEPRKTLICGLVPANTELESRVLGKLPEPNQFCNLHALIMSMDIVEQIYLMVNDFSTYNDNSSKTLHRRNASSVGRRKVPIGNDSVQLALTGRDMIRNLDIHVRNIAHKFVNVPENVFNWARNGKFSIDQKLPWTFTILPNTLDSKVTREVPALWQKMVIVSSLVFEFKLSPWASLGNKMVAQNITKNFETAIIKLDNV